MKNYLKRLLLKHLQWDKSPVGDEAIFHYFVKAYGATSLVRIQAGNTKDRKYEMNTKNGGHFFLRVSSVEKKTLFELIFAVQTELFRVGCLPNAPMGVGVCPKGSYLLDSWVSGDTLIKTLSDMGREEQFEKGQQVGLSLRRIHEASIALDGVPPLSDMFKRVLNRFKKTEFDLFGFRDEMICEIEETIRNMDKRATVLLHGDFHLNNVILDEKETPIVIDFESLCVGDPLYDYITIMGNRSENHPYRWFNQGFISVFPNGFSECDWEIMAAYYCFRRVKGFLVFYGRQPEERVFSPTMWKMYSDFLNHPSELKKWLLG